MLKPLRRIANSAAVAGRASKTTAAAQKSAAALAAILAARPLFVAFIFPAPGMGRARRPVAPPRMVLIISCSRLLARQLGQRHPGRAVFHRARALWKTARTG